MYAARGKIQAADRQVARRSILHPDAAAGLHGREPGAHRGLESRLRRARPPDRAAYSAQCPARHRSRWRAICDVLGDAALARTLGLDAGHRDVRAERPLRGAAVLREGRVQRAVLGRPARRAVRPGDHVDEGRLGHRRAPPGRPALRSLPDPAVRAARLRRVRVHDPQDPAVPTPAATRSRTKSR